MSKNAFTPIDLAADDTVRAEYRFCRAQKDAADANTFQIRMSSEWPAEQEARAEHVKLGIVKKEGDSYLEILSHNEGDIDLSRFGGDARAPLLDEHFDKRHIGYVKSAAVSKDKALRGMVTFDNTNDLSVIRRKQVEAESRPYFSLGYKHTRYLGPQTLEDGSIAHKFAFKALEVSSVAVPADPTARKGRAGSAKKDVHCIRCGDPYMRSEVNADGVCPDCVASETPARTEDPEDKDMHSFSALDYRKKNKEGTRVSEDPEDHDMRVSHTDMHNHLRTALDSHPDFKRKRDNGDMHSDFRIHDIHSYHGDGDQGHVAYVESPSWSGKYHQVDFSYDDGEAEINEVTPVEPKMTFEAVDRGLSPDGRLIRKADKKPYGNVKYADPGLQKDGKARYPVDTAEHAKAAWSYINQAKNEAKYSSGDLAKVKSKIKAACKKFGIEITDSKEKKSEATRETGRAEPLVLRITRAGTEPIVIPLEEKEGTRARIDLSKILAA